MSQRERSVFRQPREGDLEKGLRSQYREYEEWRAAQAVSSAQEESKTQDKTEKKGFKLGKLDIIFLLLGLLGAMFYQSCKSGG